ncbi:MAG: hypothetical protein BWK73_04625 [Thiothrix lacustris]|uniref:Cadherin domain-containing protein n=1 Tax=Thiothrix lacustris TaxID=525917 RepID=A0A1Y1QYC9_9GAMM|nr:MAG: hypothetical protein BWK73_04625 [Thiothrix lacustris]
MATIVFTTAAAVNVRENLRAVMAVNASTDGASPVAYSIVGGADAAKMSISANGVLMFAATPDFETPDDANTDNVYEVTVEANDGAGSSAQQSITVTVTNMDDALEKVESLAAAVALDMANLTLTHNAFETETDEAFVLANQSLTNLQTNLTTLSNKVDLPEGTATLTAYVGDKVLELENKLKQGVAPELDTFFEVAEKFAQNGDLITAMQSVGAGAIRFDLKQVITSAQQERARLNMGAASDADLQDYKAAMGNPATFDPVDVYTAAKNAALNP